MDARAQLLTLQACGRAANSAATLAGERDAEGATSALSRAERQLGLLQRELPVHARRLRLARTAVEQARRAVGAVSGNAKLDDLLREVTAAQRAAEATLSP